MSVEKLIEEWRANAVEARESVPEAETRRDVTAATRFRVEAEIFDQCADQLAALRSSPSPPINDKVALSLLVGHALVKHCGVSKEDADGGVTMLDGVTKLVQELDRRSSPSPSSVNIEVVVNGQPTRLRIDCDAPLRSLIEPALVQTETVALPMHEWEMRTIDGEVLQLDRTIRQHGFEEGARLWLNLRAGYTGSSPSPQGVEADEPHTGDDPLLDAIAEAHVALDTAIDEDDDQFGEDAREAVSTAMDALERAQSLRVAELKALSSPQPPGCE